MLGEKKKHFPASVMHSLSDWSLICKFHPFFSPLSSEFSYSNMCTHKALLKLKEHVDLKRQCGYITMLNSHARHRRRASDSAEWRGKSARGLSF